jgi:hypothetical protein
MLTVIVLGVDIMSDVMLSIIMLSVVILSIVMVSFVMLSVIILPWCARYQSFTAGNLKLQVVSYLTRFVNLKKCLVLQDSTSRGLSGGISSHVSYLIKLFTAVMYEFS